MKVADRLKEYIRAKNIGPNKKIFPNSIECHSFDRLFPSIFPHVHTDIFTNY
jgi:hypothetical protein